MKITDGKGTGFQAHVDQTNHLHVRAVIEPEDREASEDGDAFNIAPADISITSTVTTALLFFQNDDNRDAHISNVQFTCREAVGSVATSHCFFEISRNPTGLTQGASACAIISNLNFGSGKTFDMTTDQGQSSATLTGGAIIRNISVPLESSEFLRTVYTIPKGQAIGFQATAPSATTALTVGVSMEIHYGLELD